jgi:hypothetical protein
MANWNNEIWLQILLQEANKKSRLFCGQSAFFISDRHYVPSQSPAIFASPFAGPWRAVH